MIRFIPTTHGAGVRLWGSEEDLRAFYEMVLCYWDLEESTPDPIELQRSNFLAGICYDIRHAFMGTRSIAKKHPVEKTPGIFYGVEFTWTHILFFFAILRHNMRTRPCTRKGIELVCRAENSLYEAVRKYSKRYADAVMPFLNGAIYCNNPYLEQYIETINNQHLNNLSLLSPKRAFGLLVDDLNSAVYNTNGYKEILGYLQKEAKRLDCDIVDLTYDYGAPPYDFQW